MEGSDVLSAISNEECSVTSEILDKNSSGNSQSQSHLHAAEIIQVIFRIKNLIDAQSIKP